METGGEAPIRAVMAGRRMIEVHGDWGVIRRGGEQGGTYSGLLAYSWKGGEQDCGCADISLRPANLAT